MQPIVTRMSKIAAATVVAVTMAACQTDGPRDTRGRSMSLTDWQDRDMADALTTSALLVPGKPGTLKRRMRDNAIVHERMTFADGAGLLFVNSSLDTWYSSETNKRIVSGEMLHAAINREFGKKAPTIESEGPISHAHLPFSGGRQAVITLNAAPHRCVVAVGGYKFFLTPYDNDTNLFDTIVQAFHCGKTVSAGDLHDLMTRVEAVEDRAAYRTALTATGS